MRLPLRVHLEWHYEQDAIIDADGKPVILVDAKVPGNRKVAAAIIRKMNRDWRYRLFGWQPYAYTREDWFYEAAT